MMTLGSAFLFPVPFSGWVSSIKRYRVILAERRRAQVVFLTMLGIGMRESHMNDEALAYFDRALKVAGGSKDMGYPFFPKEALLENLIDLRRDSDAKPLADEILKRKSTITHRHRRAS